MTSTLSGNNTTPAWFQQAVETTPESLYLERDNARIHYLAWNDAEHDKPALVFCHGYRGHARWWSFIAPFFTTKFRVYAPDWAGMGDSDPREEYIDATYDNDIAAFIHTISDKPVTAVGHSFGGGRLMQFGAEQQDLLSHLIVVDAHADMEKAEDYPPIAGGDRRTYPDLNTAMDSFRLSPPQQGIQPWAFDWIGRHSLRPWEGGWTWKFDPRINLLNTRRALAPEHLPRLSCRLDQIYGRNSAIVSDARAAAIMQFAKNPGKLVGIPGGDHHLMISHPEALIASLMALL